MKLPPEDEKGYIPSEGGVSNVPPTLTEEKTAAQESREKTAIAVAIIVAIATLSSIVYSILF